MTVRERLEAATGERIAALEAVEPERGKAAEAGLDQTRERDRGQSAPEPRATVPEATRGPKVADQEQAPLERKPEPAKIIEGPELELEL